jgi:hypothetical protein
LDGQKCFLRRTMRIITTPTSFPHGLTSGTSILSSLLAHKQRIKHTPTSLTTFSLSRYKSPFPHYLVSIL